MMPLPSSPEKQSLIVNRFLFKKGQFLSAEWMRPCEVKKGCVPIFKHSRLVMRGGINYDNMQAVIAGRNDGTLPKENAGLPYGKWLSFPFLIESKGEVQLRLYPCGKGTIETTYYMNDTRIELNSIRHLLRSSELRYEESQPIIKNVKLKNMIDLK